jgi:mannose-1-phosphate guanylyltransferase
MQQTFVIIMAGGIGSRFWPFSRQRYPKQFHDVLGTGHSLLQETVERFKEICLPEHFFVVTNRQYIGLVKEQLPFLQDNQILGEPIGRNTAPCVAYAAWKVLQKFPDANLVVAPSDHVITKPEEFRRIISMALEKTAKENILVTLGIKPFRPDTGYGYIQFHEGEAQAQFHKVKTFTEKPEMELALKFIESGDFLWNAGIFVFSAQTVQDAFKAHEPDLADIFEEGIGSYWQENEPEFIERAYSLCKNISMDYAIMEKASNVYVVKSDFGWSDLGTWKSVYELSHKNAEANVLDGQIMTYDTEGCIIKTPKDKLVVVEGLKDFIVAEFDGVLMICRKDQEQRVKDFVAEVKSAKNERYI